MAQVGVLMGDKGTVDRVFRQWESGQFLGWVFSCDFGKMFFVIGYRSNGSWLSRLSGRVLSVGMAFAYAMLTVFFLALRAAAMDGRGTVRLDGGCARNGEASGDGGHRWDPCSGMRFLGTSTGPEVVPGGRAVAQRRTAHRTIPARARMVVRRGWLCGACDVKVNR